MKNILITGGAGFIGSHVVKRFVNKYPNYNIYNVDNLTYAINHDKITNELGWKPKTKFNDGIRKTVDWYLKV